MGKTFQQYLVTTGLRTITPSTHPNNNGLFHFSLGDSNQPPFLRSIFFWNSFFFLPGMVPITWLTDNNNHALIPNSSKVNYMNPHWSCCSIWAPLRPILLKKNQKYKIFLYILLVYKSLTWLKTPKSIGPKASVLTWQKHTSQLIDITYYRSFSSIVP